MAMTKLSKDDYVTHAHGQHSETAQGGTYGLTVGGIYQSTQGSLTNGDFSALNTDDYGNLMVNIAGGEVISATINVGSITVTKGTINAGTINTGTVNAGTINAGTVAVTAGTITAISADIPGGTIDALSALPDLPGGTVDEVTLLKAGTITKLEGGTVNVVGKYASYTGTVVVPTSDTVQSGTLASSLNGFIRAVSMVTPAMEGTGTATLTLVDQIGANIISQAQDESVTAAYGTSMPVTTSMNWVVTANGTQSADATVVIGVHYEQ